MSYSYDVDLYTPDSGTFVVTVTHYDLELDYRMSSNRLQAVATLTILANESLTTFSLDLVGLVASKVTINGVRASRFVQTKHKIRIDAPVLIAQGETFTVSIKYGGNPSSMPSLWGEVGWEELSEGVLVAGQPCGAATWFPCSDHPRNKASYRFGVTTESPYYVITNGRLVSCTAKASRTRWVYDVLEPMPAYLATLHIGRYRPQTLPPARVPLLSFIPDDLQEQFVADFSCQSDMMALFERLFGEYPFEAYTVVVTDDDLEIPLESLGISVFGRNHVDGSKGSNRLVAHELAHSWFGNSVTVSTWKDIWLQEGFACYAEWLWSENSGGKSADEWAKVFWQGLQALPQDIRVGDPGPALMFDDRVYKRGAITVHALRLHLGDDLFFDMLRSWTSHNRHGSVTTADFTTHALSFGSPEVETLLHRWLFEKPLPAYPVARSVRPRDRLKKTSAKSQATKKK